MRQHLSILAVLHAVLSAFGLFGAIVVLLGSLAAGAAVGIGSSGASGLGLGALIGAGGTFIAIFIALLAIPGLALAYGLFKRRPWSRMLGFVLGVLNLFNFPFGTAIGIYTLWVLTRDETRVLLSEGEPVAY